MRTTIHETENIKIYKFDKKYYIYDYDKNISKKISKKEINKIINN